MRNLILRSELSRGAVKAELRRDDTKAARTEQQKRTWSEVASRVFNETGDESRAAHAANAAVKPIKDKKRRSY